MKNICSIVVFLLACTIVFGQNTTIPHLRKNGNMTQLIVNGKPFLVLGGELHNSSTSGAAYMRPIWENMAKKNLNTVIAPVYWEFLEPEEGKFNYDLVDSMILGARKQNLHLVILWFGSWKNGYSMYVPSWVKNDFVKYPRAKGKGGNTFPILSTFGKSSVEADARAFKMLMKHIKEVDAKFQTVITVQIENEMGLFSTERDNTEEANKAYNEDVPQNFIKYLTENKGQLQPEIDSVWKANDYKTTGNWETIFGKSMLDKKNWKSLSYLTEELFTVYHYAQYIEKITAAGKAEYAIPMYVNAWVKQPGFGGGYPGRYPSGGPIPHTLDIWRAVAPSIDFISPDMYLTMREAMYTIEQYQRSGNPIFIPEYKHGEDAALMAFLAYGKYNAIAFAPFAIDDWKPEDDPITQSYAAISQVQNLILQHQGKGTMLGIYVDTISRTQEIELNGYKIKAQLVSGGGINAEMAGLAEKTKTATAAAGLIINIAPDEFIVIGKDFSLKFESLKPNSDKPYIDTDYMDEGTFGKNGWITTRRLNGDEGTGGGDYGFGHKNTKTGYLQFQKQPNDRYSILKFKLYRYK